MLTHSRRTPALHPSPARLRESVGLVCPPLPEHAATGTLLDLAALPSRHPLNTIGLELRAAFLATGAPERVQADNDFWRRKCRELLLRAAIEPLLLARWQGLRQFSMSEAEMTNFCSLLCGSKQEPRTRESYGLWTEGDVHFELPQQARLWWADIQSAADRPKRALQLPAYVFARMIIAHPYANGNGRLARALVHAALARTANLQAPALPLAPAFYMNGAKVAAALRQLSESGDWNAFNSAFVQVLEHSAKLARALPR